MARTRRSRKSEDAATSASVNGDAAENETIEEERQDQSVERDDSRRPSVSESDDDAPMEVSASKARKDAAKVLRAERSAAPKKKQKRKRPRAVEELPLEVIEAMMANQESGVLRTAEDDGGEEEPDAAAPFVVRHKFEGTRRKFDQERDDGFKVVVLDKKKRTADQISRERAATMSSKASSFLASYCSGGRHGERISLAASKSKKQKNGMAAPSADLLRKRKRGKKLVKLA